MYKLCTNFCVLLDDPYYCGLRARIPNFAKSKAQKEREASRHAVTQQQQQQAISPPSALPGQVPPHHPMMWHRGYLDNGTLGQVNSFLQVIVPA